MAKTEMTRAIERAILDYHPAELSGIKVNKFRGEHTALEVPVECGTTTGGIIDAVRVSEYFGDIERQHVCRPYHWRKEGVRSSVECPLGKDMMEPLDELCSKTTCRWNGTKELGTAKVLLSCFEIKVSRSDFKSVHGHNHVGNLNYYAIPKELYPQVEDMIPEGIGILLYLHEGIYTGLRMKRKSDFKELTDEDQKWLILSVMKRVRDMDYKMYHERLQKLR